MLKTRFGWMLLFMIVALLGGSWVIVSKAPEANIRQLEGLTEAPIAGYLAPQFRLKDTVGQDVALSDFHGRPVVLNFWATWCPPCRAEVPHFQSASIKYNGQAAIIGIDQGEPGGIVADFGASFGLSYPLLLDPDNSVNRDYGISALPTTIFIDSVGVVREVYTGLVNRAVLEDRIERLLVEG